MRLVRNMEDVPLDVVACEFEEAVVDVLVAKTMRAVNAYKVKNLLLGGVSLQTHSLGIELSCRTKNYVLWEVLCKFICLL